MKNAHGEIRLNIPVTVRLDAPHFSFGEAILTALRNAVMNIVTAPLRLIGRVFQSENDQSPVVFTPGTAVIAEGGVEQIRHVVEFLRSAPYAKIRVIPVTSEADVKRLKTKEVIARAHKIDREEWLTKFPSAVLRLFEERFPKAPVPPLDQMIAALSDVEPLPQEAARELAERRVHAMRTMISDEGGDVVTRVIGGEQPGSIGGSGQGRVDLALAD